MKENENVEHMNVISDCIINVVVDIEQFRQSHPIDVLFYRAMLPSQLFHKFGVCNLTTSQFRIRTYRFFTGQVCIIEIFSSPHFVKFL